jgi:hypothetical protein
MKVHVPQHMTPEWMGREVSRRFHGGKAGQPARLTTYIHPKPISIRQYIARAEQLKNT